MGLLYLETNYLMGVATGRYPLVRDLLAAKPAGVIVALPSLCVMEALAAAEGEANRRNALQDELERQSGQLRECRELAPARELRTHLEAARLALDALKGEMLLRLEATIQELARHADVFHTPGATLQSGASRHTRRQPTDNLILHAVLADARGRSPDLEKRFFTANTRDFSDDDCRRLLADAGIRLLGAYADVMQWLGHAT